MRFDVLRRLLDDGAAAMEMPCLVVSGYDADVVLNAAAGIVASATGESAPFGRPPLRTSDVTMGVGDEVVLAPGHWGGGRRVAVQTRYSRGGSQIVTIPSPAITPARAGSTSQAMAAASSSSSLTASADDDAEYGGAPSSACPEDADGETGWSSRQHSARCAGVLEVAKVAASRWNVAMTRRIVVLHLACRLIRPVQSALRVVLERGQDKVLFILTCTRLSALDECIRSRALVVPIAHQPAAIQASGRVRDPVVALAAGRLTPLGVMCEMLAKKKKSSKQGATKGGGNAQREPLRIVETCAHIDHKLAHLVSIGGDPVDGRECAARMLDAALFQGIGD